VRAARAFRKIVLELARFFGYLHPAFIHFPLVLLLVSVGLEAIGFFKRDDRFTWAAQMTLLLGTIATLFAFVAGNFAEIWAARDGVSQDPMEYHELLATITSWTFVFLTAGRLFLGVATNRRLMAVYLTLAVGACILLGVTGHQGAALVYEHGAGVQHAGLLPSVTHEDLAVLRQKQDPDALFYSNKMHHVFGWMVLILSLMLVVDAVSPKSGERLRKVGPLLLLAGGVFLMIFSDTDSWPLSHLRPITDKEVIMHKTYAILMLIVGTRGLWRKRGAAPPSRQVQSRAMAVFALIGGALLFTHVHSNAPYANVAAGVYLHHTVMGFIALSIGAVKLLEDLLQRRTETPAEFSGRRLLAPGKRTRLMTALLWAYPCLMLTESIFLLNYNEGLPWFLGYRNLSLSAPHHGTIAPLGSDRAELTYDPATNRLDVYVLNQSDDTPRPLDAASVQAVVKVGSDTTAVALLPDAADRSHYFGSASFLQNQLMFEAQAQVWLAGRTTSAPLVADFEPWIDPALAAGHTKAAYVCPMHSASGSNTPGKCPICGMDLVPNKPARPWNKLHDDSYQMTLVVLPAAQKEHWKEQTAQVVATNSTPSGDELTPAGSVTLSPRPTAHQTVRLLLIPRHADGSIVRDLAVVHTKKLHLIIASGDLSYFDHVHPALQHDGSLILDYVFPQAGDYLLYADLTPAGDRNQVFRLPVHIMGEAPAAQPLISTPAQAKTFGDYRVSLAMTPNPPRKNDETQLTFTVSQHGVPVSDLESFLGAGGHCVILSEDTLGYLHSHPAEMGGTQMGSSGMSDAKTAYGPSVTFHTLFPRPGLYKIWAQFQHHGKPLTTDFVVRVD